MNSKLLVLMPSYTLNISALLNVPASAESKDFKLTAAAVPSAGAALYALIARGEIERIERIAPSLILGLVKNEAKKEPY